MPVASGFRPLRQRTLRRLPSKEHRGGRIAGGNGAVPSTMTHAAVGLGALALTRPGRSSLALWALSAGLSMLPDIDVITLAVGVPRNSLWSHRGITHSFAAALVTGTLLAVVCGRRFAMQPRALGLYFSLVMASHGILDAFTNGGRGVAFFSPFDTHRYLFPVRPIPAAPIGFEYFSARGFRAFEAELL